MTAALELDAVRVRLRGGAVLDGLALAVDPGTVHGLVGLNGAGKTTALRVALGMLRPDSGRVILDGRDISSAPRSVWRDVGHLVETPFGYPELTARDTIVASGRLHGMDRGDAAASTDRLASILRFGRWLDTPTRRLSLGTRQKVGLAAALVHAPRLAVLDEPTNALDPFAVVALRGLVEGVAARGGAVLVTSHHFDEVARVADRVDVLHRGRAVGAVDPGDPDLERRFFDTLLAVDAGHGEDAADGVAVR